MSRSSESYSSLVYNQIPSARHIVDIPTKCLLDSIKPEFSFQIVLFFFFLMEFLGGGNQILFNFFFLTLGLFICLFIYLFMAVLGLRFCERAFSSCGKWGPLFIAVRGPLVIVASLVAEHRLQTRMLSNCGSRA